MGRFEECLESGRIVPFEFSKEAIDNEIKAAEYDLEKAEESFRNHDYKWATVKSYYTFFHSFRALLFSKNYREKSHYALSVAIEELFVKPKPLDKRYLYQFREAMSLRESADYEMEFSEESAEEVLDNARNIIEVVAVVLSEEEKKAHSKQEESTD